MQRNPRFHPSPMVPHSPSDDELSTPHTSNKAKILELLKGIQEGVENKFSSIADKLDTVCDRLNVSEKSMEEDIRASILSGASSSPRTPIPGRTRRTPPALQVKCR